MLNYDLSILELSVKLELVGNQSFLHIPYTLSRADERIHHKVFILQILLII